MAVECAEIGGASNSPGGATTIVNPPFSETASVLPDDLTPLAAFVEIRNSTCTGVSGTWTVNKAPKLGTTKTSLVPVKQPAGQVCAGHTFQWNQISYEWTKTTTTDKTDSFVATWQGSGSPAQNDFTLELVRSKFAVIDPYLLPDSLESPLPATTIAHEAGAPASLTAKGIVADGSSAAVAIFETNVNEKVTFATTNGAKVAAYDASFLLDASDHGAASITVTPIKIGANYYSVALVIAGTPPGASFTKTTNVTATTADNKYTGTSSMKTVPTPVVLIHGLWGNLSSLALTTSYLQALPAFKAYPQLVTPICYSDYLAFDAKSDTLPGNGQGCEVTSATAIGSYFSTTLYPYLNKNQIVGGRADAVAHSMGGLAVRHFAPPANKSYKSPQNRWLGQFRNVITLDTPETGSALATYLDNTAYNRTLQATSGDPYELWTYVCGSSPTTTVEDCFDANGLPLSYPGQQLSTGAVYSLEPGGNSITQAPAADIFNTTDGKWYAIDSDYKASDQPPALLRDVLNTVIAATYSSNPPTVDSILGAPENPDNDVVVTVASQTSTAIPAQTKEFQNLQHTPAPSEASLLFGGDSNASVVTSNAVNGQVAYWLGLQATAAPAIRDEETAQAGSSAAAVAIPDVKARFIANERLAVTAPQQSVRLGEPVRIPLSIAGPDVARIVVTQASVTTHHEFVNEAGGVQIGSGPASLIRDESGAASVEITPLETGAVTLRIAAVFANGGLAQKEIRLNVVPSARGLKEFDLNRGFKTMALVLGDRDEDGRASLFPEVQYEGLRYPIHLESADGIRLTVEQPEDDPVIRVDADGVVHALRAGKAIIRGMFDGISDSVEVEVYERDDAPQGYTTPEAW